MNSNEDNNTKTEESGDRHRDHDHHEHGHRHGHGRGCGHGRWGGRHRWKFIPIFLFVVLAKGALVMILWNALIPDLFHGPVLNFGQAIGLMLLAKLVVGFKGLRQFGEGGPHRHWKGRWSGLSKEQREKIREHLDRH